MPSIDDGAVHSTGKGLSGAGGDDEDIVVSEEVHGPVDQLAPSPLSGLDVGERLVQAELEVPDDVVLDAVPVGLEQVPLDRRQEVRAQRLEGLVGAAEVGRVAGDVRPEVAQVAERTLGEVTDLVLDRQHSRSGV